MRLRRGMVVLVEFLDHCEGGSRPIACRAYGKLVDVDRRHLTVCPWETLAEDSATRRLNDERYVIVRSAVSRVAVLAESE
jgi:hypothetical protein